MGVIRFVMKKSATKLGDEKITILAGVSYRPLNLPQRKDNVIVTGRNSTAYGFIGWRGILSFGIACVFNRNSENREI